jgi:hypothetical protein
MVSEHDPERPWLVRLCCEHHTVGLHDGLDFFTHRGELPAVHVGRRVRVRRADFDTIVGRATAADPPDAPSRRSGMARSRCLTLRRRLSPSRAKHRLGTSGAKRSSKPPPHVWYIWL